MQNHWFMILTLSYGGVPRCAVTAHTSLDAVEEAALETLASDRDAERVYVLRGVVQKTGMRSWINVVGWRRPRTVAEIAEGSFLCVLEERQLPELAQPLALRSA